MEEMKDELKRSENRGDGMIKQREGDRIKSELQRKMERFKEENKTTRQKEQEERNAKAIMEIEPVFVNTFANLCKWGQDISSQQLVTLCKEEMLELDKLITRQAQKMFRVGKSVSVFFFFSPWIFFALMAYLYDPFWLFGFFLSFFISGFAAAAYTDNISRKFLRNRKRLLALRKENFLPYELILKLNEKNDENKKGEENE